MNHLNDSKIINLFYNISNIVYLRSLIIKKYIIKFILYSFLLFILFYLWLLIFALYSRTLFVGLLLGFEELVGLGLVLVVVGEREVFRRLGVEWLMGIFVGFVEFVYEGCIGLFVVIVNIFLLFGQVGLGDHHNIFVVIPELWEVEQYLPMHLKFQDILYLFESL